uniref:Uncharacterized protein n=1 Tax=Peronospora matthiolae TaxID=2874970 RepID=A0AAV1U5A9_9STRA
MELCWSLQSRGLLKTDDSDWLVVPEEDDLRTAKNLGWENPSTWDKVSSGLIFHSCWWNNPLRRNEQSA